MLKSEMIPVKISQSKVRLGLLLLLMLFGGFAYTQTIYSALHLNHGTEYKSRRPLKIIQTTTFHYQGKKESFKSYKTLDGAGMLLYDEQYDETGALYARFYYTNDTTRRLRISTVYERWSKYATVKETSHYQYDANDKLINIIVKDADGNIVRQSDITLNKKGDPVELTQYDGAGNPFGKEIATYYYDENKVDYSVISNERRLLSSRTGRIKLEEAHLFPFENEIYNVQGDLISWVSRSNSGDEAVFESDYTYNSFGDCTENSIYEVAVTRKGTRKRTIGRSYNYEYIYE